MMLPTPVASLRLRQSPRFRLQDLITARASARVVHATRHNRHNSRLVSQGFLQECESLPM
jgi:hypothetical protein